MKDHPVFTLVFIVLAFNILFSFPVHAAPTETLITMNQSSAENPAIFGNYIVWQDFREGNYDIYLYDLITGTESRITTDPANQQNPEIYQDLIVWEDLRSGDFTPTIYLYDITTGGPEQPISDGLSYQQMPAIYGNRIVWSDDRSGTAAIFMNGTTPGSETPVSPGAGSQFNPAINGDLVIWDDDRGGDQNIYLFNLISLSETQVTNDINSQNNAAIYDNRIVWEDNRNGALEIYINGTAPGEEYSLTPNEPLIPHQSPAIYGSKVVWSQANAPGIDNIVMNDTGTGVPVPVAVTPDSSKQYPAIYYDPVYGDRIVWQDQRSAHNQIYLYSSTGPGTCPVAAFTSDFTGGSAPATVHFTDATPAGSTHWFWDFGDGTSATDQNPVHSYAVNNPYTVTLTVSNPWCRNATVVPDNIVLGKPVAGFTASPTSEIVPATIHFTDTSAGNPDTWAWDFGDGGISADQNPTHQYTIPGTYTVSLTASNTFGANTSTRTNYIIALNGANEFANTTIEGISIDNCGGPQTITVNTGIITANIDPANTSVLEIHPPPDRGFATITVYALDGTGFSAGGPIISGLVTGVRLQSNEIVPTGFSPATGPVSVSYSIDLPSYPCDARLNTQVWEGTTPDDRDKFERIALGSTFAHWLGTLYTTRITKTNFPPAGTANLRMSADSAWVAAHGGQNQIYVERITDDGLFGEVLRTRYLSSDPVQGLDYFEADSPRGLSTFGLSALSGSGNPFQLITLSVTSHVNPPAQNNDQSSASDSDMGTAGAGGVTTPAPAPTPLPTVTATSTPVPPDPGKSAKVYTNNRSVVTQATRLQSTDGRAMLLIQEGTVAKDAAGKPLAEITIKALPSGNLPPVSSGSVFTFAGMAYEIGPDGATFSPPISLSFTPPQAQWGRDYSVKLFDQKSGTWQDQPTAFDAATGTATAQASHLCVFALFTEPRAPPGTPAGTPEAAPLPVPAAPPVKAQPPTTAVSIFTSMMGWAAGLVMSNIVILVAVIILAVALYLVRQGKFPGSGR